MPSITHLSVSKQKTASTAYKNIRLYIDFQVIKQILNAHLCSISTNPQVQLRWTGIFVECNSNLLINKNKRKKSISSWKASWSSILNVIVENQSLRYGKWYEYSSRRTYMETRKKYRTPLFWHTIFLKNI